MITFVRLLPRRFVFGEKEAKSAGFVTHLLVREVEWDGFIMIPSC